MLLKEEHDITKINIAHNVIIINLASWHLTLNIAHKINNYKL